MIFKKTFRYLLKPNQVQKQKLYNFAGGCRWLYNWGLERKKKAYEEEGRTLSYFDLNNALPKLKEETPWLKEIHSQALQQTLRDLSFSFKNFFRRIKNKEKPGYPKFKRKGERDSFRYPQGVQVAENKIYLPCIGWVSFKKTREITGEIKETTIKEEAGKWYVCFSCVIEKSQPQIPLNEERTVGVDVGISTFATLAVGSQNSIETIENPRFLEKQLKKLCHLNRSLSRKTLKSSNWKRSKRKLQHFWVHAKNCRKDFAHKLSTQIVKSQDIIGVECLSILSLLQSAPSGLARRIADAGWRQFLTFLKYKAIEYGKALIEIDRWFASTQICSCCHKQNRLKLADRVLRCDCGCEMNRDANAAINIKGVAIEKYKAAGMSVSKLVELPC